jgi:predicted MPP superfamily phosphohydrolase
MIDGTAIRLLVNEIVRTRVGDRAITIGGVELDYAAADARRIIDRLEGEPGDADVRILVSQLPDSVLALRPSSRVDLVVAGHTHGGQVQLPLFGPPITLSQVQRSVAAGGLHRHEGNSIYVSRGVGMERHYAPRIRFLCPPEISVLHVGSTPADAAIISPDAHKP